MSVVCVRAKSETPTEPLLVTSREEGTEVNVESTIYVIVGVAKPVMCIFFKRNLHVTPVESVYCGTYVPNTS